MTEQPKSYQGIMLSSTFTDLVEHRQHAIAAIQHLGFHPNAMEYSGASIGPDVLDKSLQMVADSAAYVLIKPRSPFARRPECQRFGPSPTKTSVSATKRWLKGEMSLGKI